MIFRETALEGAFLIEPEPVADARGLFARAWCRREFESRGLNPRLVQANIALSHREGTLRGMHYQTAPHAEAKLVRCTRGRLFDAIIDLRPESPTWGEWTGVELSAEDHRMLYVPEGFAHGYLTLADDTEVFYQVSQYYAPEAERGIRWNDPRFGIEWPRTQDLRISEKDRSWPDYRP